MRCFLLLLGVAGFASAAEPVLIARPDAFTTLVNPECSHCRDEAKRRASDLRDADRVLCWIRGYSDGGAIPYRFFLHPYRVISDTYGVFVFDAEAGYARGFAPSVDFRFHGWRNGVLVMKHKDGTLYSCLTGLAFEGPGKGKRLTPVPTLTSDWGTWLRTYPQAVAYHMFDKYQPVDLPADPHPDSLRSRGKPDERLPAESVVLGVFDSGHARAYPVEALAREGLLRDKVEGRDRVILWQPATKTAAAYVPLATPPKAEQGKPRTVTLERDAKKPDAPFVDKETGSRWDIAGRAVEGELKGWTLTWLDGVQVKWFAWAAEYPDTDIHGPKPEEKMSEVAGSAEVLFAVPKKFATLKSVDASKHTVTLLLDGETEPTTWPLVDDAEVKVHGWWGRLDQFTPGDRVWAWFQLDRKKKPVALLMLADQLSEQDAHSSPKPYVQLNEGKERLKVNAEEFEKLRQQQKTTLAGRWERDGLPGTMTFVHISGEVEFLLDHEAMRWGRSLQVGDKVSLAADPPVSAVVKSVKPWRERTQLRLVIKGLEIGDLKIGQRLGLKMTTPPVEVRESPLPPDLDRQRTKEERLEWFLSSIYCTCKVKGDRCTGMFYTLASCNPNGCGMPNGMRSLIGKKIDKGMTDRQIFEELLKDYGPDLTNPHLLR
jgi:hypothetical protein